MKARSAPVAKSHLYVVGEVEESRGPVKIGLTTGPMSKGGRPNLGAGNWRTLCVLHGLQVPPAELRWREWLTHAHLQVWRVRGEWFDVRAVADEVGGWTEFLDLAYTGNLAGCSAWRLGNDEHHLASMARLTVGMPRQFSATCSCRVTVTGPLSKALESVQVQFAIEHLRLAITDPAVRALRKRKAPTGSDDEKADP